MQKKCLVFLTKTIQTINEVEYVELKNFLQKLDLEYCILGKREEYETWYEMEGGDEVALLIYDGEEDYFKSTLYKRHEDAFILWLHSESPTKTNSNHIKEFTSFIDLFDFLELSSTGESIPPEFKQRVIEKSKPNRNSKNPVHSEPKVPKLKQKKDAIQEEKAEKSPENVVVSEDINHMPNREQAEKEKSAKKDEEVSQTHDDLYYKRSRDLQKQLFINYKRNEHKMIGLWSPVHRTGVTSLTINFAFFLSTQRIYTAVLEGLTEHHMLKDWLLRYTKIPENWVSFSQAIHTDGAAGDSNWTYKDVKFLPLDQSDIKLKWNAASLESYMTTTKVVDVTLVDMPTGKMSDYSLHSLQYLDELWILADDAYQENLSWKSYIEDITKHLKIPKYLIFNKTYEFSQTKRLAKDLSIPLLTSLPAMHQEVMKNYYEASPLISNEDVLNQLADPFTTLAKHLFGKDFEVKMNILNTSMTKKWMRFFKQLK